MDRDRASSRGKPTSRGATEGTRGGPASAVLGVVMIAALLGLGACSPSSTARPGDRDPATVAPTAAAGPPDPWVQAHGRWDAHAPAHYRFVWSAQAMAGSTRVLVEVRDHRVVASTVFHDDLRWVDRGAPTVDDLFAEVRRTQQVADAVAVTYDPALGYPTEVRVDRERHATDDEYSVEIQDLRPA